MLRLAPLLASGFILFALLQACTGDDPALVGNGSSASGGTSSSSTSSGGTGSSTSSSGTSGTPTDGGPTSCLGKTFNDLRVIVPGRPVDAPSGTWIAETIRPSATSEEEVYFSARLSGATGHGLFRTKWKRKPTDPSPALADGAQQIVNTNLTIGDLEWWPAVSRDVTTSTIFLVFEHANVSDNKFNLRVSYKPKAASEFEFDPAAFLDMKGGDVSERTPWFAGTRTKSLYWSRSLNGNAFRIMRAAVKVDPGGTMDPTFDDIDFVDMACPGGDSRNCDTPAVTPDERTMLFSTSDKGSGTNGIFKSPKSFEVFLDGARKAGTPIPHPELEGKYPTWISDDGCEAIFGNETEQIYARR